MLDGEVEEVGSVVDCESDDSRVVVGEDSRDTEVEGLKHQHLHFHGRFTNHTVRDAPW